MAKNKLPKNVPIGRYRAWVHIYGKETSDKFVAMWKRHEEDPESFPQDQLKREMTEIIEASSEA